MFYLTLYFYRISNIAKQIFDKKNEKNKLKQLNGELSTELDKYHTEFMVTDSKLKRELDVLRIELRTEKFKQNITEDIKNNFVAYKDSMEKLRENHRVKTVRKEQQYVFNQEEYYETKKHYQDIINNNKERMDKLSNDIEDLDIYFTSLTKVEKKYYEKLLFNGIDTRFEGLVWIVRRLLELDSHIEDNLFPKFLDFNQIKYLKNVKYKEYNHY